MPAQFLTLALHLTLNPNELAGFSAYFDRCGEIGPRSSAGMKIKSKMKIKNSEG